MILIFAGAGASKAVNPKQYPTTVEFFERLPGDIKSNELFRRAVEYIKERNEEGHIVDIEQILWLINDLRDFNLTIRDLTSVPGWFLSGGRLSQLGGYGQKEFATLPTVAASVNQKIDGLASQINTVVYELYAESPTKKELKSNWLALLESLSKVDRLEIATTNYDLVIEEALFESKIPVSLGRRIGIQSFLDTDAWNLKSFEEPNTQGLLTKLHGSVDWIRRGNKIQVSYPAYQGQHERHAIIYPGFKGTPNDPLFQRMHDYFHVALTKADVVVFIGYAFRDAYINDLIRQDLPTSATVLILNPASLTNLPIPEERLTHIKQLFDEKGVATLLNEQVLKKALSAKA